MSKVHKACNCVYMQNMFFLDNNSVEIVRRELCPENQQDPQQAAEEIIDAAKDKAFKLIAEAQSQASILLDSTRESAYSEGFEKGKNEALAEFSGIIAQAMALLAEMQREKCSYLDEMKPQLVDLSIRIAERVINHEIALDKGVFTSMVSAALEKANGCEELEISVNPVHFDELEEIKSKLASGLKSVKSILVIADEGLDENDCLIKTECGSIDTGVNTMIRNINEAFSEKGNK